MFSLFQLSSQLCTIVHVIDGKVFLFNPKIIEIKHFRCYGSFLNVKMLSTLTLISKFLADVTKNFDKLTDKNTKCKRESCQSHDDDDDDDHRQINHRK